MTLSSAIKRLNSCNKTFVIYSDTSWPHFAPQIGNNFSFGKCQKFLFCQPTSTSFRGLPKPPSHALNMHYEFMQGYISPRYCSMYLHTNDGILFPCSDSNSHSMKASILTIGHRARVKRYFHFVSDDTGLIYNYFNLICN